jgi:hypothetical protein
MCSRTCSGTHVTSVSALTQLEELARACTHATAHTLCVRVFSSHRAGTCLCTYSLAVTHKFVHFASA